MKCNTKQDMTVLSKIDFFSILKTHFYKSGLEIDDSIF